MAEPKGIPDLTQLDPSTIPTDPDKRDLWFANLAKTTGWGPALKLRQQIESGTPVEEGEGAYSAEEALERGRSKVQGGVRVPIVEEFAEGVTRLFSTPKESRAIDEFKKREREEAEKSGKVTLDVGPSIVKLAGVVKGFFPSDKDEQEPYLDLLPGMEVRDRGQVISKRRLPPKGTKPFVPTKEQVEQAKKEIKRDAFFPDLDVVGEAVGAAARAQLEELKQKPALDIAKEVVTLAPVRRAVREAAEETPATRRFVEEQQRDIDARQIKTIDDSKAEWVTGFLKNTGTDLKDLVVGVSHIANELVGVSARQSGITREEAGEALGEALGVGMLGGAAAFLDPDRAKENWSARPVMTFLNYVMLLDAANAMGVRVPASVRGRVAKVGEKLGEAIPPEIRTKAELAVEKAKDVAKTEIDPTAIPGVSRVGEMVETMFPRVAEALTKQRSINILDYAPIKRLRQRFSDAYTGRTAAETARTEKIARGAEEGAPAVRTAGEAVNTAVKQTDPPDLVFDADLPDTQNTLTQTQRELLTADLRSLGVRPTSKGLLDYFGTFEQTYGPNAVKALASKIGEENASKVQKLFRQRRDFAEKAALEASEIESKGGIVPNVPSNVVFELLDNGAPEGRIVDYFARDFQSKTGRAPEPAELSYIESKVKETALQNELLEPYVREITGNKPTREVEITPDEAGGISIDARRQAKVTSISERFETGPGKAREATFTGTKAAGTIYEDFIAQPQRTKKVKLSDKTPAAVNKAIDGLAEKLGRVYGEAQPEQVAAIREKIIQATFEPTYLVRNNTFRRIVRRQLKETLEKEGFSSKQTIETLRAFDKFVKNSPKDGAANNFVVRDGTGRVIFDRQNVLDAFTNLPEQQQKGILQTSIVEVANKAAQDYKAAKVVEGLLEEASWVNRSDANAGVAVIAKDPMSMAEGILRASMDAGREPMVAYGDRTAMVRHLRSLTDAQLLKIAEETGPRVGSKFELGDAKLARLKVIRQLERMEDAGPLRPYFRDKGGELTPPLKEELAPAASVPVSVTPFLKRSLSYDLAPQSVGASIVGEFLTALQGSLKRNIVAANLPSLFNDALSNIYLQTFLRGNPSFIADLISFNSTQLTPSLEILQGKRPLSAKPVDFQFIKNLYDHTDIMESNVFKRDIMRQGGVRIPLVESANEWFAEMYSRYSDTLNKVEHGVTKQKEAQGYLDALPEGSADGVPYFVELPIDKTRVIRVVRKDGELYGTELMKGSRLTPRKKQILGPERKLSDDGALNTEGERLLGRHGNHAAEVLFFDYGRIGTWFKDLRSLPALGLVSPFATWFVKATPLLGGLGLGLRVPLSTFLQGYRTNVPALQALNTQAAAGLAIRQAAQANAQYAAMSETLPAKEVIGESLTYNPDSIFAGNIIPIAGGAVGYESLGSVDFTEPTQLFLRMGGQLGESLFGKSKDEMKEELFGKNPMKNPDGTLKSPEERRKINEKMRAFVSLYDGKRLKKLNYALKLAGMEGDFLFDLLVKIQEAKRQGKTFDLREWMGSQGWRMFLGGTIGRTLQTADAFIEKDLVGDYEKRKNPGAYRSGALTKEDEEPFVYALRTFIGKSFNRVEFVSGGKTPTGKSYQSKITKYAADLKREMKANLTSKIKKQEDTLFAGINNAVKARDTQKASVMKEELKKLTQTRVMLENTIDIEVEQRKMKMLRAFRDLYAKERRIKRRRQK